MQDETTTQLQVMTPDYFIEKAVSSGASIDMLEKLIALQERWQANKAKEAFNEAFSTFQSTCPPIPKNRKSKDTGYKYADMDMIVATIKAPLAACGLSYRFEFADLRKDPTGSIETILAAIKAFNFESDKLTKLEKMLREIMSTREIQVTCIIKHKLGHSEVTTMVGPEDYSGYKNAIQSRGSSTTYLERYTLIGALGLVTADSDDDGKGAADKNKKEPLKKANGNQMKYITGKILAKEVTLETARQHYSFTEDQEASLKIAVECSEKPEELLKKVCAAILAGKGKYKSYHALDHFTFSDDDKKTIQVMDKTKNAPSAPKDPEKI